VRKKILYTGYLRRAVPQLTEAIAIPVGEQPYVLVTVGGGRRRACLSSTGFCAPTSSTPAFRWRRSGARSVHAACDAAPVPGARKLLPRIAVVTFDAHVELLMEKAVGVVAMAGYNTFCEILSLDKRAILVPRTKPREEQLLRRIAGRRTGARAHARPARRARPAGHGDGVARASRTSRCRRPEARRRCWVGLDIITDSRVYARRAIATPCQAHAAGL
jgi:hypothetical protein